MKRLPFDKPPHELSDKEHQQIAEFHRKVAERLDTDDQTVGEKLTETDLREIERTCLEPEVEPPASTLSILEELTELYPDADEDQLRRLYVVEVKKYPKLLAQVVREGAEAIVKEKKNKRLH
jgi:hypothetical protein